MKGPFLLPDTVREGDYIEIGNTGAYAPRHRRHFNGYGQYEEVILQDEPMYSMYDRCRRRGGAGHGWRVTRAASSDTGD